MPVERTFFMIKPDGVQRALVGRIMERFEARGFKIVAMKMLLIDREKARKHYQEHTGKPFFNDLVSFITSGPVVAMVLEGENAVEGVRAMMGRTNPKDSAPGTIRGDMAVNLSRNVVHGSDSLENAKREISIFFNGDELLGYERIDAAWLYPDDKAGK